MLLGFNSTSVLLTCGLHMPVNAYMLSLCSSCSPWPCIVIFLPSLSANSCQTVTSPLLLGEGLSKNPLKSSSSRKKTLRGSDPISRWTGGFCIFSFTSQPQKESVFFHKAGSTGGRPDFPWRYLMLVQRQENRKLSAIVRISHKKHALALLRSGVIYHKTSTFGVITSYLLWVSQSLVDEKTVSWIPRSYICKWNLRAATKNGKRLSKQIYFQPSIVFILDV